jgi:hypothetical protein
MTFLCDAQPIWNQVLPRRDLCNSFVVIEWEFEHARKKYVFANPDIVRQWLRFLIENHPEYVRLRKNNLLKLSDKCHTVI